MEILSKSGDVIWKPLPKQSLAMACPALELLYGGEKGAAKTDYLAACWIPLLNLAQKKFELTGRKQHKCRIVVFRKNLDHLKDFIAKTHGLYPYIDEKASFNVNYKTWHFESGATLECRHLDGPEDHRGFHGNELVGTGWDQVEQIPYEQYSFVNANCRSSDPDYHRSRMIRCTANPGGYDWLIQHFGIDKFPDGGRIFNHEIKNSDGSIHKISRAFIKARLRDNPYLPPDYEAQLRASMTEDEVAMYLEGDWFRVAWSYFSKLLRPRTHFVKSYPVPSSWEFRYSIDWGSTNPACWLLGARDNDGRLYIIDELHKPGVTGRRFGEDLKDKYARQKWSDKTFRVDDFWGVIDKQAMDKYGSEETAAAGIMEWGFNIFPAKKDRDAGCNQLKERLLLDKNDDPQIVIFEDRCPNLVRALSGIKSQAPKNPDDYDDGSDLSHAIDALRFLVMEFPVRKQEEIDPRDRKVREWNDYLKAARFRQEQRDGSFVGGDYD